jgi:hypothetical protein
MTETPEKMNERQAAEDYRRQLQEAEARRQGDGTPRRDATLQWTRENRSKLLEIARRSGAADKDIETVADEYVKTLLESPPGSDLDDPGATRILRRIIERIEAACSKVEIPKGGGVVYGTSVGTGVVARQLRVFQTEVSIIEATLPFIIFCDLVSKALVHALPEPEINESGAHLTFDSEQITERLRAEKWILAEWVRILVTYAAFGTPPNGLGVAPQGPRLNMRGQLLDAMEVFAIAHEYGHHALDHGVTTSANEEISFFEHEHAADSFARVISLVIGKDENAFFLLSGAGGALILGAIELITRTRTVLTIGQDGLPHSTTHPPVAERIRFMDDADLAHLPKEDAEEFVGVRRSMLDILDAIWAEAKPVMETFFLEGLRPVDDTKGPSDWLPFTSAR